MRKWLIGLLAAGLVLTCLAGIVIYNLPPVHDRLAWRVDNLRTQIRRAINPPEEAVFVPQQQLEAAVQATLLAMTSTAPTQTATITATAPPASTATPQPSPTPTSIPGQVSLSGIRHEYQSFNNCGPANLAMTLSYWGWQGDQRDTAAVLRPGEYDKNVMPAEMVAFVEENTDLKAVARVGGDLETIKRFIAAGFPVLIEKGYDPEHDDWMGHYLTLNAYDDTQRLFTAQELADHAGFPTALPDGRGALARFRLCLPGHLSTRT